ncbi:hypothetical protein HDU99_001433 [Rhizoclosmatium hyalinum]|nr:hypothetical protein HDU99_001433 [Rhizoclosmatium hyalinum]
MQQPTSHPTELPFEPGTLTPAMFLPLYTAFLHAFHAAAGDKAAAAAVAMGEAPKPKCKLADHLIRFEQPPMYEGRTFNIFDFFEIVKGLGGFSQIQSWTALCRKVNMNPAKSNISTRLREWADKHHIIPFFDFLLGAPNDFYRDLRPDEIIGNIKIEKDGFDEPVLESDKEMWLRLYGLDGGLTTRKKKPVVAAAPPPPIPQTPQQANAASTSVPSTEPASSLAGAKRLLDLSSHNDDGTPSGKRRRHFDADRIVIIGGVPHAALSIAEQKVLNDVNAKLKALNHVASAVKVEGGQQISTANLVSASGGGLIVPSASSRLEALQSSLDALKSVNVVAGAGAGLPALSETDKLKAEVSQLLDLLKGQQVIIDGLRKRVANFDE